MLAAAALALLVLEAGLRGYDAAAVYLSRPEPGSPPPVPLHVVTNSPTLYELNPEHPDISSQGFRDDEVSVPKPAGTFRVLVLGDSVAYGSAVPRGETFANLLEAELRRELPGAEVVNAGVMGYTPYNELQFYLTKGRLFEPDLVIVAFCMNDVANPRLHWGDAPGVRVPREAIPNEAYDREHILPVVRRLEEQKRTGAPEGPPVLRHSRLYRALAPALARAFRRSPAVPTRVTGEDDLSIEVLLDRSSPEWRWLASTYDRLREAVRADGAEMTVVFFPLAYQMDESYPFLPQRRLAEYCRERSLRCLDLLPPFRRHDEGEIFLLDKEGHDDIWHLTRFGHELTARELLRFLREERLLP